MSPQWLDDWLEMSGGEKEYHKGIRMLRTLSAGAVKMCRQVWGSGRSVGESSEGEERRGEVAGAPTPCGQS